MGVAGDKKEGCFSEPIPRKGTETIVVFSQSVSPVLGKVFQNLFPARGRKLFLANSADRFSLSSFSEPIPRKGTETFGSSSRR